MSQRRKVELACARLLDLPDQLASRVVPLNLSLTCVCERERERENVCVRESVCLSVCEREREKERVNVCVYACDYVSVCACVCECV